MVVLESRLSYSMMVVVVSLKVRSRVPRRFEQRSPWRVIFGLFGCEGGRVL